MQSDKKNSTCMVYRQRQSIITHNGSEMIMFSRFASVLQIDLSKKPPNVVPHHVFVILSLRQRKQLREFRETALKANQSFQSIINHYSFNDKYFQLTQPQLE